MLEQILVLHSNKFVGQTISEFAKKDKTSVYLLDNAYDFSYLINDLKPQAILAQLDSLKDSFEDFKREVEAAEFKNVALVLLGKKSEIDSFEHTSFFNYRIEEPFDPAKICQTLTGLLESESKTH